MVLHKVDFDSKTLEPCNVVEVCSDSDAFAPSALEPGLVNMHFFKLWEDLAVKPAQFPSMGLHAVEQENLSDSRVNGGNLVMPIRQNAQNFQFGKSLWSYFGEVGAVY